MANYPPGRFTRDKEAYRQNPNDQGTDRRVADLDAHGKLDQIIESLNTGDPVGAPVITSVIAEADMFYYVDLPPNCKGFFIKANGKSTLELSFEISMTTKITLFPGQRYSENRFYASQTIYFTTNQDDTIEVVAYT